MSKNGATSSLIIFAILVGSAIGLAAPEWGAAAGTWVDPVVFTLVTMLLFEVKISGVREVRRAPAFLTVAWAANFTVIPLIGFLIASLFFSGAPLLFIGVMIYFCAPCTDWFLGFTRMADGNTSLGAALLPINLLSQLLLYPLLLAVVASTQVAADPLAVARTLLQWFVFPLAIAVAARVLTRLIGTPTAAVLRVVGSATPLVIAALIGVIFAANILVIVDHAGAFAVMLVAVFLFFATTYLIAEALSRLLGLAYPEQALLAMTTAARNAPLMLALTTVALPAQPLVYAAIVVGMLVEFPHLTAIKHLLLRRRAKLENATAPESASL